MTTTQPAERPSLADGAIPPEWRHCRLLLLEDDPDDQLLIERALREVPGVEFAIVTVGRVAEAQEKLARHEFDVVLCDMGLPDGTALELLQTAPHRLPPMVVLTGNLDETFAAQSLASGAQDYLFKSDLQPRNLWNSIRYSILRHDLAQQSEALRIRELELKDQVLSHVSHELRTPLSAVLQFVAILSEGIAGPLEPRQQEYLGIVQRNALQLKRLIGDLMDVARISNGKFTLHSRLVDLSECMKNAAAAFSEQATERGIRISGEADEGLPPVLVDPDRVYQVLINLIGNAMKFSPDGGEVTIRASSADLCGSTRVEVSDQGPGIPEEERGTIFDRLRQADQSSSTSRKGLGLGLYIAREIVERSGGDIGVESAGDRGSRFWFTLPNYSLSCSICRASQRDGQAVHISLLTVDVNRNPNASAARSLNDAVLEARRTIESCLQSCNDTVLPEHRRRDNGARVFALIGADGPAIEGIRQRVEDQLAAANCRLARWNYLCEVRVGPVPTDGGAGGTFLAAARWIQQQMDG